MNQNGYSPVVKTHPLFYSALQELSYKVVFHVSAQRRCLCETRESLICFDVSVEDQPKRQEFFCTRVFGVLRHARWKSCADKTYFLIYKTRSVRQTLGLSDKKQDIVHCS